SFSIPVMLPEQQPIYPKANMPRAMFLALIIHLVISFGMIILLTNPIREVFELYAIPISFSIMAIGFTIYAVNKRNLFSLRVISILMVAQLIWLIYRFVVCSVLLFLSFSNQKRISHPMSLIDFFQVFIHILLTVFVLFISWAWHRHGFGEEETVKITNPDALPTHDQSTAPPHHGDTHRVYPIDISSFPPPSMYPSLDTQVPIQHTYPVPSANPSSLP
ncbi:hypothetical protein PENTCL1PPCAC_27352, partial [Pristionchus entomophagus]